jgi:TonB family protein
MRPHGLKLRGIADAVVTIAPSGHVSNVRVLHSSGNAAIDAAVVTAARHSTYRPKVTNCAPVEGSYIFHVEFKP